MQITIIPVDSIVLIGGVPKTFDFSELIDPSIHAVQFDDIAETGEIEFVGHIQPNEKIDDITAFQSIIDAYNTIGAE